MELVGVLILLEIINNKANPNYKIAWIIPVLTIPIFGTFFYLVFASKPSFRIDARTKTIKNNLKNNLKQDDNVLNNLYKDNLDAYNQSNYLIKNNFPVYNNTDVEYFSIGEDYYSKLISKLKEAKHFIFLEYFIIHEGKMWNTILDILIKKAKEGVDVRVIYDDIGCIVTLPSKYYKKLNEYGIKAVSFNQFVPVLTSRLNNRDHRKIFIIDGNIAFTGGINLADEYINEINRFGHWKDNGIMLKGEAVWSLTVMFLNTWNYVSKTKDDYNKFRPNYYECLNTASNSYIQPYDDVPIDNEVVGKNVYLNLIHKAKKYIYITTPYLIIDDELENSLILASKNGVDVRIITPGIADKKIVNEVTKAYYPNLIDNGIKIYEYEKGFIHSKTFLIDDLYATVGTINLDYRSLYLHFECGVLIYKDKCIKDIKSDLLNTMECSKIIKKEDTKVDFKREFIRSILKLFAPLM
jgi:cardiolipin synthase